jgi:putative glutamine amidotransferase
MTALRTEKTRPVVGIVCCNREVGDDTAQAVMNRYVVEAIRFADAAALLVPALPGLMSARQVIGRLDGVLLTGSPSNVDPVRYGQTVADAPGPFDTDRDAMSAALIDAAIGRGLPVFGICRGLQEINVAFGGTLRRDMSAAGARLPHHAPDGASFDEMFEHRHMVRLREGGLLARAYDETALEVNSVHYQGIDRVGDGLRVEAYAPDGAVEAVSSEVNGAPVLAVQWHPEWRADENPQSQTFFRMLGRALRGEPAVPSI